MRIRPAVTLIAAAACLVLSVLATRAATNDDDFAQASVTLPAWLLHSPR